MALLAISIPILPGKTEKWQSLINELNGSRRAEFKASREALGVHERTFLQKTPVGDFVLVTLEGADPQGAMARFGQGKDPFTQWFVAQVNDIHGMDLSAPPPGPLPELVIDSAR